MESFKNNLLARAQPMTSKDLSSYVLATPRRDLVMGDYRACNEGQIVLADPDTFIKDDTAHRRIFSTLLGRHVALKDAEVQLLK